MGVIIVIVINRYRHPLTVSILFILFYFIVLQISTSLKVIPVILNSFNFISDIPNSFDKVSNKEAHPVQLDAPTKKFKTAEPSVYAEILHYKSSGNTKAQFIFDSLAERGKGLDKVRI